MDGTGVLNRTRVSKAFSLGTNLRYLLSPRSDAVAPVTGLRALSMFWVLIQHVQQGLRPLGMTLPGAVFLAHPVLSLGWAGNLAIEMFFVVSGYLIGGMLMRERDETGTIALRSYYVRRALRILPVYLLAAVVYLALPTIQNKDAVWANLLFVNNFVPFTKQFMAHCWSLAIEEQFFTAAPLLVLLLYCARPSWRTPLLWLSIALACAIALFVVFTCGLELSLRFPNGAQFWRYMDTFYTKPHTRFGSLAMGILVAKFEREGYWQRVLERRPIVSSAIAAAAFATMISIVVVFPEARGPSGEKLLSGSLRLALNSYAFGASTAYLLFLMRTRHALGRGLAAVLGSRVLHPVAQLSYAMYLFHPICITPLYGLLGFDLTHPWLSYARLVVCAFLVSAAVAAVVFLFVELPVLRMRPPATAASVSAAKP